MIVQEGCETVALHIAGGMVEKREDWLSFDLGSFEAFR
jgi:hypothetical protein